MATPSPTCTVKDGSGSAQSTTNGVDVTPGNTVTIALATVAGADVWSITCIGTDETSSTTTANAALTVNSVTKTATFTAPAAGTSWIFRSTVQSAGSSQSYSATFKVCTLTASGRRVAALGETVENSATYGWTQIANYGARNSGMSASARVTAIDSNHLFAWEMTGSSSPVSNSGSGGSADLTAGGAGSSNLVYGAVSPLGKCVQSINNATAYFTRDGALSGLTTTLTFEVWILYHYLGGTYTVMGHTRSGASNLAVGISSAGAVTASYRATGFTSLTMKSNFALSTGVWHHLALTSDGTTANMYANGELIGTGSGAGSFDMGGTTPKTVLLGDPNNSNQVFNGRVCRFRVSNIARSQTYLRNVYAAAIGASDYASVT